jgi:GTP cyclohydrolase I
MYSKPNKDTNMFFRVYQSIPASYYRFFDVNASSKEEAIEKCKELLSKSDEDISNEELFETTNEFVTNQEVILTGFEFEVHDEEEHEWDIDEDDDDEGGVTIMGGFPPLFLN